MSFQPEVLLRPAGDDDRQPPLPFVSEGVQRWVWQGRFGAMLIEVVGEAVYVNGQRVEPHAP